VNRTNHRARLVLMTLWAGFFLVGCLVGPPKGVTAFVIDDKTEYAGAMLIYPKSEEARLPLKLKFVDTNTFQTTATLAPGPYMIVLRTEMGRFLKVPVQIETGKNLYHVSVAPAVAAEPGEDSQHGATLRGTIYVHEGQIPREVAIVFVDRDVVVRRAAVAENGRFEVEAPARAVYWVEIFGFTPTRGWKWQRGKIDLRQNLDLQLVPMQPLE